MRGSAAARWGCGFESQRGRGYLSAVKVVPCAGIGFCDGPILYPEENYRRCVCVCVCVSLCVIRCDNNPLHLNGQVEDVGTKRRYEPGICRMEVHTVATTQSAFTVGWSTKILYSHINMYKHTYITTDTYTHTHKHTHTHTHPYTHTYIHKYIQTNIHTYNTYIQTYIYIHTYIQWKQ